MGKDAQHETRERIFDAAAKLFAERGYGAVSMREIAEHAEVSKPMLYYYFDSKAGLCRALLDWGIERSLANVSRILRSNVSIRDRISAFLRQRFSEISTRPELVKFHIDFLYGPDTTGLREEYRERMFQVGKLLRDAFFEAQARGELREDVDPAHLVKVFIGMANVFIGDYVIHGMDRLDDDIVDMLTEQFMQGAGSRRPEQISL